MEAILMGKNKKRKRNEVEGLDDMDDHTKRRIRMREERLNQLRL